MEKIKGYKVFNPDWTCMGKQYTCPGVFEEDVIPSVCNSGMHFCKKAADCFNYYSFSPENHVAEVITFANRTVEDGDICATNQLEVVREIPWAELLEIVNTGKGCTGLCNSGNWNSGNWNSGNRNTGDWNSGDWNSGYCNSGDRNTGNWNSGNRNTGNRNTGNWNSGDRNSGNWNTGNRNSGDCNTGNWNTGNRNSGYCNSGDRNSGDRNSGDRNSGNWNSGNRNSGDWNKCNCSNGCFNTVEPKIYLFNTPSAWTYRDWLNSYASSLMNQIPDDVFEYVRFSNMTDEEKAAHPEAETTGGYLKEVRMTAEIRQAWWDDLSTCEKKVILSLPNFDAAIFKEITGIDVSKEM